MDFFKQNIIPGEVLVQLIAFLIVFSVLKAMAWKPVQAALAARRKKIQDEFEQIEHAKQDIERLKKEYSEHLQKIEEEARLKIQQSIEDGRRIAREIQDKARVEAQASFEKSKENLVIEVEKARISLKRDIAGLAIQVAEKVLEENLNSPKHHEKAMQMIEKIEKTL